MRDYWYNIAAKLIKEHGISQGKLSEKLGISPAAFNHWMHGRREPKLDTVLKILHMLGLRQFGFDANGLIVVDAKSYEDAVWFNDSLDVTESVILSEDKQLKESRYPVFATRTEITALPQISPTHKHFLNGRTPVRGEGYWVKSATEAMSSTHGLSVPEGSLVLFDTALPERDGSLGLFYSPASPGLMFRQLQIEAGQRYLKGLNPKWPTVPLPRNTVCLGVAVELRLFFGAKDKR